MYLSIYANHDNKILISNYLKISQKAAPGDEGPVNFSGHGFNITINISGDLVLHYTPGTAQPEYNE